MIYLDTSARVPLFVPETTSAKARTWLVRLSAAQRKELTLSAWTLTEFASAIGLKVRNCELARRDAKQALGLLHEERLPNMQIVEVTPTDFRLAETMLREFSVRLRAGDALHLAVASRAGARRLVALDQELARVAATIGVAVTTPA